VVWIVEKNAGENNLIVNLLLELRFVHFITRRVYLCTFLPWNE